MTKKLLWLDLETTGLDPRSCYILEIAAIVTDEKLNELDRFHRVVKQPWYVLNAMDAWCTKTHTESGLLRDVKDNGGHIAVVQEVFIEFIQKNFGDEKPHLAGNSVHFDKSFLYEHMPMAHARLHHRILDVSSFKLWLNINSVAVMKGTGNHRALADIESSIQELKSTLALLKNL